MVSVHITILFPATFESRLRFFALFTGFFIAIEVGPQPTGVLRADVFNMMKEALDLTLEWLQKFNSGRNTLLCLNARSLTTDTKRKRLLPLGSTFEGGQVDVYVQVRSVDYPRDPKTSEITAAIHPQLQVRTNQSLSSC